MPIFGAGQERKKDAKRKKRKEKNRIEELSLPLP